MSASYGQRIEWWERRGLFRGCHHSIEYTEFDTPQKAFKEAFDAAKAYGWTPPRWWQWWRWGDLDYTKSRFYADGQSKD